MLNPDQNLLTKAEQAGLETVLREDAAAAQPSAELGTRIMAAIEREPLPRRATPRTELPVLLKYSAAAAVLCVVLAAALLSLRARRAELPGPLPIHVNLPELAVNLDTLQSAEVFTETRDDWRGAAASLFAPLASAGRLVETPAIPTIPNVENVSGWGMLKGLLTSDQPTAPAGPTPAA